MKTVSLPILEIDFWDHSASLEGGIEPYRFKAVGVCVQETADYYILAMWISQSHFLDNPSLIDGGTCIVKSAGMTAKTRGVVRVKVPDNVVYKPKTKPSSVGHTKSGGRNRFPRSKAKSTRKKVARGRGKSFKGSP